MEELLIPGYRYTFTLVENRNFIGRFIQIDYPTNTIHISEYTDENGTISGIRTMPFYWIKHIEIIDESYDIETIELTSIPMTKKKKKLKKAKKINNFMN